MSQVLVNETSLTAIADAIREKNGETTTYKPSEMSGAILQLSSTGNETYPNIYFRNNCACLNYDGRWDWYFESDSNYSISMVENAWSMFENSNLDVIPPIRLQNCVDLSSMFSGCNNLKELPALTGYVAYQLYSIGSSGKDNAISYALITNMFSNCHQLRTIPSNYLYSLYETNLPESVQELLIKIYPTYELTVTARDKGALKRMFYNCYSLRNHCATNLFDNDVPYTYPYTYTFYNCYSLDEIYRYYVPTYLASSFNNFVTNCYRLKNITFDDDVIEPKIAQWHDCTIDLTGIGYGDKAKITGYNSGITEDKEVYDDATYQALKNDPDWFSQDINYSRYNKLSAVNTINSLPDCSAYLTSQQLSNNIVKFYGDSGKLTDGGAINTLTEEEIAVATAKGYTISLIYTA